MNEKERWAKMLNEEAKKQKEAFNCWLKREIKDQEKWRKKVLREERESWKKFQEERKKKEEVNLE